MRWLGCCLQKAFGVEPLETLSSQLIAEALQGRGCGLVDGLLRDAKQLTNLGVAVAFSDEGEDLLSS